MKCKRCNGTGIEPDRAAIARAVKRCRLAAHVGLREMARRLQCSPAYLVDLESGGRSWQGPIARKYQRWAAAEGAKDD